MTHFATNPGYDSEESVSKHADASYTGRMSENTGTGSPGGNLGKDQYLFGSLESSAKNRAKVREVSYGFEQPEGVFLTSLDFAVNWVRKNSVWPMTFGLA